MALDKLVDSTQLDADLTSVANAIRTKGGTSASLAFPADFVTAIGNIQTGGGGRPEANENDVVLIDFDGRILYSYTAAEFANLSELPTIPVLKYPFLQQDGWNWTLSDAKTYVAKYKGLVIGAQYTTTDGKDHVYVDVPKSANDNYFYLTVACVNAGSGDGTVTVDWGDGTSPSSDTVSKNSSKGFTHYYSQAGLYDIKVSYSGGAVSVYGRVSAVGKRGFVKAITFGTATNALQGKFPAGNYDIIILSGGKGSIGKLAEQNYSSCYVFPRGWAGLYGTSNYFTGNANAVKSISFPNGAAYTGGGYNFSGCGCLRRIYFTESITSVGQQTLYNCFSLARLDIPSTVTSIATKAFAGCSGIRELHFYSATPPTVAAVDAFTSLPTACKIYVPTGYLTAYTTASNYPDPNTYTYAEE